MFKFTYFIYLVFFIHQSSHASFYEKLKLKAKNNDQVAIETLKRINDYGLKASGKVLKVKEATKARLDRELNSRYLNDLIATLGCEKDGQDCLVKESSYQLFKGESEDVCFPGTNCEFYKCMENKYKCSKENVNYFTELAYPTCSTYIANMDKNYFTKKGVEWIYEVMVCLQKGLVKECEIDGMCDQQTRKERCDHIVDYTLNFHPSCYLNSGVGVCHLPLQDKLNIWRTVGKFLTKDEREQAYKVVFKCVIGEEND